MFHDRKFAATLCALLLATCWAGPANAQFRIGGGSSDRGGGIVGTFDSSLSGEPAKISASFVPATAERPALIMVTARLEAGWHAYSVSQTKGRTGGPQRTMISLRPSPKYRVLAPFRGYPEFKSHVDQLAWKGLELQEHEGEVTWYAPIEVAAGVDASALEIKGLVDMQVCKEQCVPVKTTFAARAASADGSTRAQTIFAADTRLASITAPASFESRGSSGGSFQATGSEVKITGQLVPSVAQPGQSAQLRITMMPARGFHVYAQADRDDEKGSKETLIAFESAGGLVARRPTTDAQVIDDNSIPDWPTMHYHKGNVTWTVDIDVPADAEPGRYPLTGVVAYMACEDRAGGTCEMPKAARFQVALDVGTPPSGLISLPVKFVPATYKEAATIAAAWVEMLDSQPAKVAARPSQPEQSPAVSGSPNINSPTKSTTAQSATGGAQSVAVDGPPYDLSKMNVPDPTGSLVEYLALAFVGGLILNLMPCVLPVIGLKVMSFVEQSGRSRGHALVLNVWYAAGIIAVFLLLGLLAVTIGLSWGGQFGSTAFNVVIAAVVFAMALSLLGVWEIPIPGFFGSGSVQNAAAKEGPTGAFLKGVVTTVLATPCTAPFMASAVAWAVSQKASTTLLVFLMLGLGMSSPYLLIGLFPKLLRFLPKPGRWMETFKQVTGFILLGTVVFILSYIEPAAVVPTVLLLTGIGFACWLVARTPLTAELRERLQAWSLSGAVVLAFVVASFAWLYPQMVPRFAGMKAVAEDGWGEFSLKHLQQVAVNEGRTVIVDFSANWCVNCRALEFAVLNTESVERAIAAAGAVKMYADYSDYPEEITTTLKHLKSNGVPVIAIFPGNRPHDPIVFRGGYSRANLITALQSAKNREGIAAGTTLTPNFAGATR